MAHGSESFVCVVHSRRYVYIHHLWVFERHRPASFAGPEIECPSKRYQPLDYSRILSWLIIRPFSTLGSVVAHDSERFGGVVHSRRYVYIQHWWVFERHRSASLGLEIERPSNRYQPLDYFRILPSLTVRPCPALGRVVAYGSESFVGVVHSRWYVYVYIQQWWYSSRVHARVAALLAVRTGHTAVVVVVQ